MSGRPSAIVVLLLIGATAVVAAPRQAPTPGVSGAQPCKPGRRIDRSQFDVAEATGGQALILDPTEVSRSAAALAADLTGIDATISRMGGMLDGSRATLVVPVDSTVTALNLSIFVECLDEIIVMRPAGVEVQATDDLIEEQRFRSGRVLTAKSPDQGDWRVSVSGRGLYSAIARARGVVALNDVVFLRQDAGDEARDPEARIVSPVAGTQQRLVIHTNGISAPRVTLVTAEGAEIQEVIVETPGPGELAGAFIVPTEPFRVAVDGLDARGVACRRMFPALVRPAIR